MSAMDVIRKYSTYRVQREAPPRSPATTRIIDAICVFEKTNPQKGQHWMAMLCEFRIWTERNYEARLRAEGRLLDSPQPRTE